MMKCELLKAVEEYIKAIFDMYNASHNLMVEVVECVKDIEKGEKLSERMAVWDCEMQIICDMFPEVFESEDEEVLEVLRVMGVLE
jgi:hypothetical protein